MSISNSYGRRENSDPRLYYLDDIPTPYRLGVQRRIAQQWGGAFRIAYCAEIEPGRRWSLDFDGLDVEFLPGRQWRPPMQRNPFSFKWNPTVIQSLEAFRPDVVVLSGYAHSTMRRTARWCRRKGIPYGIVCESSCRNSHCSGWRWLLKRILVAPLVRNMAFGLPVGHEAADYLQQLAGQERPMFFFPNTPDTSMFIREADWIRENPAIEQELREKLGIPSDKKIVLFAGRMIKAKRPADAIKAFFQLDRRIRDNAVLVMVGEGPLLPALREMTGIDTACIIFPGWLSDARTLARLMAISRCLLLPSEHEPWGAVVNEAMAAGIPVVASDKVSAAIELVEPGIHGFLHAVGNVQQISSAMAQVLADRASWERMARAARRQAQAHGEEFAADNFIKAVNCALSEK